MAEQERVVEREPEATGGSIYERNRAHWDQVQEKAHTGKVVVKGAQVPWEQNRQGRVKFLVHRYAEDLALNDMHIFLHEIHTHSGKHRHQGGVALLVVEGKGYTTVDGETVEWEEGDLILVPVQPGGCEHQHFNLDPSKPSKWLALRYYPDRDALGWTVKQVETSPDFRG